MLAVENLLLVLACVYVADALVLAERSDIVLVGWHAGRWTRRRGIEVHLGRTRVVALGGVLPPLHPAVVARGERVDSEGVAALHARFLSMTWPLRWMSNALFVALFVILPLALVAGVSGVRLSWVLALVVILWLMTGGCLAVVVRRLYPDAGQRPAILATVASPISAVRAVDTAVKPLLAAWHPLSVAHALSPREEYLALARERYFDGEAADAELVRRFLASVGDLESVTAPPDRDPTCDRYCPKCHSQFRSGAAACPDCDVPLRPHDA